MYFFFFFQRMMVMGVRFLGKLIINASLVVVSSISFLFKNLYGSRFLYSGILSIILCNVNVIGGK